MGLIGNLFGRGSSGDSPSGDGTAPNAEDNTTRRMERRAQRLKARAGEKKQAQRDWRRTLPRTNVSVVETKKAIAEGREPPVRQSILSRLFG